MQPQPDPQLADLGFRLIPPAPALRPYVRHFWALRRDAPLLTAREEYMHPRGRYGIVFNLGGSDETGLTLDAQPLAEPVFLDGVTSISRRMGFAGKVDLIGVSFNEGRAYPFLAIPLGELRDAVGLLDALDRTTLLRLHNQLAETPALPDRVRLLEDWLTRRLTLEIATDPLVPETLGALRRAAGRLSIANLAGRYAISQRHLERRFHEQVGISPKAYARLLRVETARLNLKRLATEPDTNLAHLAVELGFYDQPHFIREFRAVVGMTPARYMKRDKHRITPTT